MGVSIGTFLVLHPFPISCKYSCKQSEAIKGIRMREVTSDIGPFLLYCQVSTEPPCCLYLCHGPGNYVVNHCTYRTTTNWQFSSTNRELGDCDPSYYSFFLFGTDQKRAGNIHTPSVPEQLVS